MSKESLNSESPKRRHGYAASLLLESIKKGRGLIHRLVVEHLHEDHPQAFLSALGTC
jgi:hypothetical protein